MERLDRSLANQKGMEKFPASKCTVLPALKFDQSSLLLSIISRHYFFQQKSYIFRYEAGWDLHDKCAKIVRTSWQICSMIHNGPNKIQSLLKQCKVDLKIWKTKRKQQENGE